MDPIISIGVASAAHESGKVVAGFGQNVFGPSTEVIGKRLAERADRLFAKADKRRRGRDGQPSQRVAAAAFQGAAFTDEEIVSDYLSGVLAASSEHDDQGLSWASLIGRLSTDQLKLHFYLYMGVRPVVQGDPSYVNVGLLSGKNFYTDKIALLKTLWPDDPLEDAVGRFDDSLDVLVREGLVGDEYEHGSRDFLISREPKRATTHDFNVDFQEGLHWMTSISGFRLLWWGLGYGAKGYREYLDPDTELDLPTEMQGIVVGPAPVPRENAWLIRPPRLGQERLHYK